MRDNKLKINPPLYLIGKKIHCWNCDNKMPVIALLAPNVDDTEGEIFILSDIQELPKDVYFFIKNRVPSFRMKYSNMAGHKYLGNTCPESFSCMPNRAVHSFLEMKTTQNLYLLGKFPSKVVRF